MKKLLIVRHAKTSWKDGVDDFDRTLKKKGILNAPFMAEKLLSRGLNIKQIISSSANRTTETTHLINSILKLDESKISFLKVLYLAPPNTLINAIKTADDEVDELMIIAHNPGVSQAVNYLANEHFENIPTSGMACILFDINSWSEIKNNGTLGFFIYPKMFKQNIEL